MTVCDGIRSCGQSGKNGKCAWRPPATGAWCRRPARSFSELGCLTILSMLAVSWRMQATQWRGISVIEACYPMLNFSFMARYLQQQWHDVLGINIQ